MRKNRIEKPVGRRGVFVSGDRLCLLPIDTPPIVSTSGVPQGFVLAPILFTLYITELSTSLSKLSLLTPQLFADDLKIFASYSLDNYNQAHSQLSMSADIINEFCNNWQLYCNAKM